MTDRPQLFGLDSQLGKRLGARGGLEPRGAAGDPSSRNRIIFAHQVGRVIGRN